MSSILVQSRVIPALSQNETLGEDAQRSQAWLAPERLRRDLDRRALRWLRPAPRRPQQRAHSFDDRTQHDAAREARDALHRPIQVDAGLGGGVPARADLLLEALRQRSGS